MDDQLSSTQSLTSGPRSAAKSTEGASPVVDPSARAQPWISQLGITPGKVQILVLLFGLLWLVIVGASWANAADAPPPSATASSDDDYSFNWLDPDKKIYVLQNRRYTKVNHAMLSVMVGPGLSNPYRSTFNIDPRLAYYFSEAWGVEFFYTVTTNSPNNTAAALNEATVNTVGVVHEIHSQTGGLIEWVPWYAKINVFNKILYFDWYFSGGAGLVNTQFGSTNGTAGSTYNSGAAFLGTGHLFHLSESVTFRLDFTGAFYDVPVIEGKADKSWYSNFNLGLGLGIRL